MRRQSAVAFSLFTDAAWAVVEASESALASRAASYCAISLTPSFHMACIASRPCAALCRRLSSILIALATISESLRGSVEVDTPRLRRYDDSDAPSSASPAAGVWGRCRPRFGAVAADRGLAGAVGAALAAILRVSSATQTSTHALAAAGPAWLLEYPLASQSLAHLASCCCGAPAETPKTLQGLWLLLATLARLSPCWAAALSSATDCMPSPKILGALPRARAARMLSSWLIALPTLAAPAAPTRSCCLS
mmetsp:Transcript_13410/g.31093  ORF Transcript_13410/g.31093 Transcript_13410/m.31093 type:complete len:251 (-) Transcript_13410:150-902(-)